jgi:hypothetical protein
LTDVAVSLRQHNRETKTGSMVAKDRRGKTEEKERQAAYWQNGNDD